MAELSAELTDRIIDFLHSDKRSLAACSLVCKSWVSASRFHLFRELVLTPTKAQSLVKLFGPATAKDDINLVEQPLENTSKVSRGRNELLRIPHPLRPQSFSMKRIKTLLKRPTTEKVRPSDAPLDSNVDLCSFSSSSSSRTVDYVQRVSCRVNSSEPEWLTDSVMRFIASLPQLSEFSGSFATHIPHLKHLKNLKKFSVESFNRHVVRKIVAVIANSPELEHLDVLWEQSFFAGDEYEEMPRLQDLIANISRDSPPLKLQHLGITGICLSVDGSIIPHLRSLTSLVWVGPTEQSSKSIWQVLTSEGIQLFRLKTNVINDDLLDYLSFSQGMTDLRLVSATGRDEEDSNRLARRFYQVILPRHADTLKILHIEAALGDDWRVGKDNIVSIANCVKLEELGVSLFWPIVIRESSGGPMPDFSDNAVDVLLNAVSQLHCLRSLKILTTHLRNLAGSSLDYPMCYQTDVYMATLEAVNRFEMLDNRADITGLPGYELLLDGSRYFVPRAFGL